MSLPWCNTFVYSCARSFWCRSPKHIFYSNCLQQDCNDSMSPIVTMHLRLKRLSLSLQAFNQVKNKWLLIASDALKHVRIYFKANRFLTSQRKSSSMCGGPFTLMTLPITQCQLQLTALANCKILDTLWVISGFYSSLLWVVVQFPQRWYQSKYIAPIVKKFLPLANNSTIYPKIGAQNPPIGLCILILTAVSLKLIFL